MLGGSIRLQAGAKLLVSLKEHCSRFVIEILTTWWGISSMIIQANLVVCPDHENELTSVMLLTSPPDLMYSCRSLSSFSMTAEIICLIRGIWRAETNTHINQLTGWVRNMLKYWEAVRRCLWLDCDWMSYVICIGLLWVECFWTCPGSDVSFGFWSRVIFFQSSCWSICVFTLAHDVSWCLFLSSILEFSQLHARVLQMIADCFHLSPSCLDFGCLAINSNPHAICCILAPTW